MKRWDETGSRRSVGDAFDREDWNLSRGRSLVEEFRTMDLTSMGKRNFRARGYQMLVAKGAIRRGSRRMPGQGTSRRLIFRRRGHTSRKGIRPVTKLRKLQIHNGRKRLNV